MEYICSRAARYQQNTASTDEEEVTHIFMTPGELARLGASEISLESRIDLDSQTIDI